MSYEGIEQFLCDCGHQWELDCYECMGVPPWEQVCPTCRAPAVWWNSVDQTNGSYETVAPEEASQCLDMPEKWSFCELLRFGEIVESGEPQEVRTDGYVELEVDKPAEFCECSECGNKHVVKEATYKVPEELGHRVEKATFGRH